MNGKKRSGISRREFTRRAAIVTAVSLVPASAAASNSTIAEAPPQQTPDLSALPPESQAEAEARYQTILNLYGTRFSEAQKADLRRLCFAAQPPLDRLRSFAIDNGSAPSLYLKPLIEREVKHIMPPGVGRVGKAGQATKKP
jgi:hypothetical protein